MLFLGQFIVLKVALSPYKKICVICLIESPLKMMRNAFYFILKTFRSQDIWPCRKNPLIRKIRLTSKFMTSQPGLQTIAIHTLLNITPSRCNQTMKFGQLIEYNKTNIFFQKLCRK